MRRKQKDGARGPGAVPDWGIPVESITMGEVTGSYHTSRRPSFRSK